MLIFAAVYSFSLALIVTVGSLCRIKSLLSLWICLQLIWILVFCWIYQILLIKLAPIVSAQVAAQIHPYGLAVLISNIILWLRIRKLMQDLNL